MKLHCFICATTTFPDDPVAEQQHHGSYLHAQVTAFQRADVQLTLIQNGCENQLDLLVQSASKQAK